MLFINIFIGAFNSNFHSATGENELGSLETTKDRRAMTVCLTVKIPVSLGAKATTHISPISSLCGTLGSQRRQEKKKRNNEVLSENFSCSLRHADLFVSGETVSLDGIKHLLQSPARKRQKLAPLPIPLLLTPYKSNRSAEPPRQVLSRRSALHVSTP